MCNLRDDSNPILKTGDSLQQSLLTVKFEAIEDFKSPSLLDLRVNHVYEKANHSQYIEGFAQKLKRKRMIPRDPGVSFA